MKQLCGGTISVDHVTNYIFNNNKVNLVAATTVESKHKCELKFDKFGIQIKQYAADNHPFHSKVLVEDYAGIFKQFLTRADLIYFTLFFIGPRWLLIEHFPGLCY